MHQAFRHIREPGYKESEPDPAPRFFMGRTLHGNLWRARHDLPEAPVRDLERLVGTEAIALNLAEAAHNAAAIRATLHAHAPITREERGPAYWIADAIQGSAEAVLISEANPHLLEAHFPWARPSRPGRDTGPLAAVVIQDRAVSLCFCARLNLWAAEAGVETVEAFRGQGYASSAVRRWAIAVRRHGLIPLYSTSWENAASQGVARKLGMVRFAEDWSIW